MIAELLKGAEDFNHERHENLTDIAIVVFVSFVSFVVGNLSVRGWQSFRNASGTAQAVRRVLSDCHTKGRAARAVPVTWSAIENVKWKAPLPQPSNGSPIVSDGQIFIRTYKHLYCLGE